MVQLKISVDDEILVALRAQAAAEDRSLSATAARILRAGLSDGPKGAPIADPYKQVVVPEGARRLKMRAGGESTDPAPLSAPAEPSLDPPSALKPWVRPPFKGPDPRVKR